MKRDKGRKKKYETISRSKCGICHYMILPTKKKGDTRVKKLRVKSKKAQGKAK